MNEASLPTYVYRVRMTLTFYRADGSVIAGDLRAAAEIRRLYCYEASTFESGREIEQWKLNSRWTWTAEQIQAHEAAPVIIGGME